MRPRKRIKPRLLVSTSLHGNRADLETLRGVFETARAAGEDVHWLLLGDLVHGPDTQAGAREPELYGFADESPALVDAVSELQQAHPGRVHLLLGNHDAGHLGFAHTSRFHADEVEALEARLTAPQRERLRALFARARLAACAPCGLFFSHGAPGDAVTSLGLLDGPLQPEERGPRSRALNELLWSYGQTRDVAARFLARASEETGFALRVVVHGHDRDAAGWFVEGGNQVQPVLFGAPDENQRYLWLDLGARYESPDDLREGHEVRRLYPR
jgi:hypothetical protein